MYSLCIAFCVALVVLICKDYHDKQNLRIIKKKFCNNPKANGKVLLFFVEGIRLIVNVWVGLQKRSSLQHSIALIFVLFLLLTVYLSFV